MIDYKYIQDIRTKDELKAYVEVGLKNQKIAVEAIKTDWEDQGEFITIEWITPGEKFWDSVRQIQTYKPDVKLVVKDKFGVTERICEVKVSDKQPGEFIWIKANQIEKLYQDWPGSEILYCTPTKYMFLEASWVAENCQISSSDRIGGKLGYRIWTPGLTDLWYYFQSLPKLVPYPKMTNHAQTGPHLTP